MRSTCPATFTASFGAVLTIAAAVSFAQGMELKLISRPIVEDRLRMGVVPARERGDLVARIFQDVGCQVERQQVDKLSSNVICLLQGETNSTIVVGAHYDLLKKERESLTIGAAQLFCHLCIKS